MAWWVLRGTSGNISPTMTLAIASDPEPSPLPLPSHLTQDTNMVQVPFPNVPPFTAPSTLAPTLDPERTPSSQPNHPTPDSPPVRPSASSRACGRMRCSAAPRSAPRTSPTPWRRGNPPTYPQHFWITVRGGESRQCQACGAAFTLMRRRHHCRVCGNLFCSGCTSKRDLPEVFLLKASHNVETRRGTRGGELCTQNHCLIFDLPPDPFSRARSGERGMVDGMERRKGK
jgi:hypothetical protein